MDRKSPEALSPLKSMLSSPLRNVPAVPIPDWSSASPAASSQTSSRTTLQSNLSAIVPNNLQVIDPQNNVVLQNCVATVDLGCELNLLNINFRTRNSEYNPMKFHGVVMRIREPRATALIFKSGKIVCTGARTEADAMLASKKFGRIIQKLGFNVRFNSFKIQNIVATCDLRFPIKLENLNQMHGQFTNYEPELFPALIYRMVKPRLVLLIFVNGKIVFTGAKSRRDLKDALDNIYPVLKSFKKN